MLAVRIKAMEKTLIKITILVVIFSVFLRINNKTIYNYLLFLGVVYLISMLYILYKMSYHVEIYDDHLYIKNFFSSHTIKYQNIKDFFITEGYLQRKFGLHSIYIITRTKNYLLKDMPDAEKLHDDIQIELNNNNVRIRQG